MRYPRSLAAPARKALCLTVVMFCVGAWMAPAANAQLIGDVVDGVIGGGGDGSTSSGGGSGDTSGGGSGGGLIGGVIDGLDGDGTSKDSSGDDSDGSGGGGLIGGVIDSIDKTTEKTTDKTTETVEETTGELGGSLGGVGQTIDTVTDDPVTKVKKGLTGTSGPGKKKKTAGGDARTTTPVTDTWDVLGESFMRANGAEQGATGESQTSSSIGLITPVVAVDDSVVAQIGRVAAEAVEQAAFPLALLMLVGGFLMIQNRIDRKDPKLALAPVDSEHDLLSFT